MARLDGFIGNFVRKYALIRDFRSRHRLFHQLHRMDGLIGKLGLVTLESARWRADTALMLI